MLYEKRLFNNLIFIFSFFINARNYFTSSKYFFFSFDDKFIYKQTKIGRNESRHTFQFNFKLIVYLGFGYFWCHSDTIYLFWHRSKDYFFLLMDFRLYFNRNYFLFNLVTFFTKTFFFLTKIVSVRATQIVRFTEKYLLTPWMQHPY